MTGPAEAPRHVWFCLCLSGALAPVGVQSKHTTFHLVKFKLVSFLNVPVTLFSYGNLDSDGQGGLASY